MSNWEYKVITSGKGGFASPALLEKFLNDLGQESWEILHFQTLPDNPLAFTGLARRTTQRDWTLEDAAKAAARAEADKLRAEFEAKFKAATGAPAPADEPGETFLAEEKSGPDGGLRRLRDTSRDDDPDAPEEEGAAPKDDWDKLAAEDELPSFFDALRPHMRRNQRGPGMSVGVDFLAKKWRLEESDVKGALVECGLQIPADENARPVNVEYEGDLYWVNINRRGEIWINTREKPQPVFRIVPGKRVVEEQPAAPEGAAPAVTAAPVASPESPALRPESPARFERPERAERPPHPPAVDQPPPASRSFLGKLRSLMRRNRRGQGWSGSFPFLTKALRTDEAGLLAQLADLGVLLAPEGSDKPAFREEGDFLYWMNKNQRGEIWINARKGRSRGPEDDAPGGDDFGPEGADHGGQPEPAAAPADLAATPAGPAEAPAHVPAPVTAAPASAAAAPAAEPPAATAGQTLSAVRLLLEPKKRGEGFTALVSQLAIRLGQPEEKLLEALVAAGLNVPADAKDKPSFGENAGEIFWLNRSTKGALWLNAKDSRATAAKKSRVRKKSGEEPPPAPAG